MGRRREGRGGWMMLVTGRPLMGRPAAAGCSSRAPHESYHPPTPTHPPPRTCSSSARTCSSMAVHRRSRQSERPAGSDSSESQMRMASGKENSWVSASVIHLWRGRWTENTASSTCVVAQKSWSAGQEGASSRSLARHRLWADPTRTHTAAPAGIELWVELEPPLQMLAPHPASHISIPKAHACLWWRSAHPTAAPEGVELRVDLHPSFQVLPQLLVVTPQQLVQAAQRGADADSAVVLLHLTGRLGCHKQVGMAARQAGIPATLCPSPAKQCYLCPSQTSCNAYVLPATVAASQVHSRADAQAPLVSATTQRTSCWQKLSRHSPSRSQKQKKASASACLAASGSGSA